MKIVMWFNPFYIIISEGLSWVLLYTLRLGNFKPIQMQTMTEAEHNRPIPKLFDNRPSASAAEVFCETIGLVIYIQNIPIIVSFSLLLS